jgi:hypothetical protein
MLEIHGKNGPITKVVKIKKAPCGTECDACVICEKSKVCCDHKYEMHGCVTWKREPAKKKRKGK